MIEVKDLEKTYPGTGRVLTGISFTIPDGQIVGLLGRNGVGKTTLLKRMAGITGGGGTVLYDGRPPQKCYEDLAFLSGDGSFFPEMTACEYADFLCRFYPRFDRERFGSLLSFFELNLYTRQKLSTLSKGQKTRVELAAGFSKGAKYLLLDEPFSGKDVFSRKDFLKLLTAGLRCGETLLISTHDVEEMENIFDRVLLLRYGGVHADLLAEEWQEDGRSLSDLYADTMGYDDKRYQKYL
ncbi:MAG: ATP-binding cassette domain-containing protein [Candidatus Merdivicinus sp.]|jgi:ABC-2 type transport system ATP-binding protein